MSVRSYEYVYQCLLNVCVERSSKGSNRSSQVKRRLSDPGREAPCRKSETLPSQTGHVLSSGFFTEADANSDSVDQDALLLDTTKKVTQPHYTCHCGVECTTLRGLQYHDEEMHQEETLGFTCKFAECKGKTYHVRRRNAYKQHLRNVHNIQNPKIPSPVMLIFSKNGYHREPKDKFETVTQIAASPSDERSLELRNADSRSHSHGQLVTRSSQRVPNCSTSMDNAINRGDSLTGGCTSSLGHRDSYEDMQLTRVNEGYTSNAVADSVSAWVQETAANPAVDTSIEMIPQEENSSTILTSSALKDISAISDPESTGTNSTTRSSKDIYQSSEAEGVDANARSHSPIGISHNEIENIGTRPTSQSPNHKDLHTAEPATLQSSRLRPRRIIGESKDGKNKAFQDLEKKTSPSSYACTCGASFTQLQQLKDHEIIHQEKGLGYMCEFAECKGKAYLINMKTAYRCHLQKVHNIRKPVIKKPIMLQFFNSDVGLTGEIFGVQNDSCKHDQEIANTEEDIWQTTENDESDSDVDMASAEHKEQRDGVLADAEHEGHTTDDECGLPIKKEGSQSCYSCFCGSDFTQLCNLNRHYNTFHCVEKLGFLCPYAECKGKAFDSSREKEYKFHLQRSHNVPKPVVKKPVMLRFSRTGTGKNCMVTGVPCGISAAQPETDGSQLSNTSNSQASAVPSKQPIIQSNQESVKRPTSEFCLESTSGPCRKGTPSPVVFSAPIPESQPVPQTLSSPEFYPVPKQQSSGDSSIEADSLDEDHLVATAAANKSTTECQPTTSDGSTQPQIAGEGHTATETYSSLRVTKGIHRVHQTQGLGFLCTYEECNGKAYPVKRIKAYKVHLQTVHKLTNPIIQDPVMLKFTKAGTSRTSRIIGVRIDTPKSSGAQPLPEARDGLSSSSSVGREHGKCWNRNNNIDGDSNSSKTLKNESVESENEHVHNHSSEPSQTKSSKHTRQQSAKTSKRSAMIHSGTCNSRGSARSKSLEDGSGDSEKSKWTDTPMKTRSQHVKHDDKCNAGGENSCKCNQCGAGFTLLSSSNQHVGVHQKEELEHPVHHLQNVKKVKEPGTSESVMIQFSKLATQRTTEIQLDKAATPVTDLQQESSRPQSSRAVSSTRDCASTNNNSECCIEENLDSSDNSKHNPASTEGSRQDQVAGGPDGKGCEEGTIDNSTDLVLFTSKSIAPGKDARTMHGLDKISYRDQEGPVLEESSGTQNSKEDDYGEDTIGNSTDRLLLTSKSSAPGKDAGTKQGIDKISYRDEDGPVLEESSETQNSKEDCCEEGTIDNSTDRVLLTSKSSAHGKDAGTKQGMDKISYRDQEGPVLEESSGTQNAKDGCEESIMGNRTDQLVVTSKSSAPGKDVGTKQGIGKFNYHDQEGPVLEEESSGTQNSKDGCGEGTMGNSTDQLLLTSKSSVPNKDAGTKQGMDKISYCDKEEPVLEESSETQNTKEDGCEEGTMGNSADQLLVTSKCSALDKEARPQQEMHSISYHNQEGPDLEENSGTQDSKSGTQDSKEETCPSVEMTKASQHIHDCYCGSTFTTLHALRIHEVQHQKEGLGFLCEYAECAGKAYYLKRMREYKLHLQTVHKLTNPVIQDPVMLKFSKAGTSKTSKIIGVRIDTLKSSEAPNDSSCSSQEGHKHINCHKTKNIAYNDNSLKDESVNNERDYVHNYSSKLKQMKNSKRTCSQIAKHAKRKRINMNTFSSRDRGRITTFSKKSRTNLKTIKQCVKRPKISVVCKKGVYKCSQCGASFTLLNSFHQHQGVHQKEGLGYLCEDSKCAGQAFFLKRKNDYMHHLQNVHKIKTPVIPEPVMLRFSKRGTKRRTGIRINNAATPQTRPWKECSRAKSSRSVSVRTDGARRNNRVGHLENNKRHKPAVTECGKQGSVVDECHARGNRDDTSKSSTPGNGRPAGTEFGLDKMSYQKRGPGTISNPAKNSKEETVPSVRTTKESKHGHACYCGANFPTLSSLRIHEAQHQKEGLNHTNCRKRKKINYHDSTSDGSGEDAPVKRSQTKYSRQTKPESTMPSKKINVMPSETSSSKNIGRTKSLEDGSRNSKKSKESIVKTKNKNIKNCTKGNARKKGTYICSQCGASFALLFSLHFHQGVHQKEGLGYLCEDPKCGGQAYFLWRKDDYVKHLRNVHKIKKPVTFEPVMLRFSKIGTKRRTGIRLDKATSEKHSRQGSSQVESSRTASTSNTLKSYQEENAGSSVYNKHKSAASESGKRGQVARGFKARGISRSAPRDNLLRHTCHCGTGFRTMLALKNHEVIHQEKGLGFLCSYDECSGKAYYANRLSDYKVHLRRVHKVSKPVNQKPVMLKFSTESSGKKAKLIGTRIEHGKNKPT